MIRRNVVVAVVAICVILLGVFLYSRRNDPAVAAGSEVVGSIDSVTGQVQTRIARTLDFNPVLLAPSKTQALHSQELVQADKDSAAVLTLNSGTSLQLSEETKFVAEIDASRPGSLIGTILEGHATVLAAGKPNLFRLFSQGARTSARSICAAETNDDRSSASSSDECSGDHGHDG